MTARNFHQSPADYLGIADETVRLAVELAATMVLADHDLDVAKYAAAQAALTVWGGKDGSQPGGYYDETVDTF